MVSSKVRRKLCLLVSIYCLSRTVVVDSAGFIPQHTSSSHASFGILVVSAASNTHDKKDRPSKKEAMAGLVASMGLRTPPTNVKQPKDRNNNVDKKKKTEKLQMKQQHLHEAKTNINKNDGSVVPLQTQLDYSRKGHASLRNFLPPGMINELLADLQTYSQTFRRKGEDSAPFLQFFNTWRDIPSVQRLTTCPLLCQAACTLLDMPTTGTAKLRLYQDSVFIKRRHDGITPWHIDGRMMPFDTSRSITFWIPLQPVNALNKGGTGLLFINQSHSDFSLPYWNGRGRDTAETHDDDDHTSKSSYNAYDHLATRYGIEHEVGSDGITTDINAGTIDHHMPLSVGDCTVHSAWTTHCANGNKQRRKSAKTRYAIAVTYVDSRAEVRHDIPGVGANVIQQRRHKPTTMSSSFMGDAEDRASYADWIGDVLPRTQFEHEFVPDVWPRDYKK